MKTRHSSTKNKPQKTRITIVVSLTPHFCFFGPRHATIIVATSNSTSGCDSSNQEQVTGQTIVSTTFERLAPNFHAGKRTVLVLSHDVTSSLEDFKFAGACAGVLITVRALSREVRYDVLTSKQKERMNVAMSRACNKWNQFGVMKFLSKTQLDDIMTRGPNQKILRPRWVLTERVTQENEDYKARLVVQGC